ncbi:MAG: NAD(P)-dependent oxidoreductase [Lachnospira sp.]|nr:NAD(P)-dependent oxidoreductase [Lachnospira sp.]
MKRVVITGPTGAIGMALIDRLIAQGIRVVAVVRPDSKRSEQIVEGPYVEKVFCDLSELSKLSHKIDGKADVFYHLGWDGTFGNGRNNMHGQNLNVKYALDAVEAAVALGCKRFVGAGSQAEYGRHEGKLSATVPTFPENGYGMAKLCAGQMTRGLCQQKGIEHIWVRILSVYGPYDGEKTMIMSVVSQLLKGESPACTKGEQMWDYIYSKDAAKAMALLGVYGKSGKIYCIGSGKVAPLKEYIESIRKCVSPETSVDYGAVPYAPNQVMYLCADIDDLKEDTGFETEYTFEQGIIETVEWVKKH